jgi:GNAT superfamily N-acetyltransferase
MSIRPAIQTDVTQIAGLVKSLAHFYLDDPRAELPSWLNETLSDEAFTSRISSSKYLNFVFEEADSIVGYISIESPGHLYHLFVSEKFQGKGISRLLWEHARQNCHDTTFSLRSSLHAIPVYKQFGFSESGPVGTKDGVSFQPMRMQNKC